MKTIAFVLFAWSASSFFIAVYRAFKNIDIAETSTLTISKETKLMLRVADTIKPTFWLILAVAGFCILFGIEI